MSTTYFNLYYRTWTVIFSICLRRTTSQLLPYPAIAPYCLSIAILLKTICQWRSDVVQRWSMLNIDVVTCNERNVPPFHQVCILQVHVASMCSSRETPSQGELPCETQESIAGPPCPKGPRKLNSARVEPALLQCFLTSYILMRWGTACMTHVW